MDEQQEQTPSTGPVTIEDVQAALGDTDPYQTNAGTIRQRIGRGSLSTIQKHLEALRRQQGVAEGIDTAQDEIVAPEAPKGLLRGIWESAYGVALATVQDKLIVAQERIVELEGIRQAQCEEIESMADLVDQAEAERDQIKAEAKAAREAQAKAEAERDDALRLRDQIAELMAKIDAMTPAA
jgi:chromosome segregation ATPase